jgi:hypothetical protein
MEESEVEADPVKQMDGLKLVDDTKT